MPVENGQVSSRGTHITVGLLAVFATLMVMLFGQLHNHEQIEGHPGVLKITSGQQAEIDSLSFQAQENRRRLGDLEVRTEHLAETDARLSESIRAMETIPTLMARIATIESEVKVLDQVRDEWIRRTIHQGEVGGQR